MIVGVLALPLCACQTLPRVADPEPLNPVPPIPDAAMRARQWDPSAAVYSTGGVWAWPNYITWVPDPLDAPADPSWETTLFLGNVAYSPVPAWTYDPMWKMVLYQELSMDPTYTAMPVLPPSTQPTTPQ
jgi:hypothetical protein